MLRELTGQTLFWPACPETIHLLPESVPHFDTPTYELFILAKARFWKHVHFDQMPLPPDILDLISEQGANTLRTVRFTNCSVGGDKVAAVEASLRFVRRCENLREFTLTVFGSRKEFSTELDELLRERGIGPAKSYHGRRYLEEFENRILWAN
ncbi:hypothetical protein HDV00_008690 [Rhizophlyctis rosea]|nr:hypothetical protein HDV00_008690 [Rhizophlyctis rosea]